jgi:hypothetical protein
MTFLLVVLLDRPSLGVCRPLFDLPISVEGDPEFRLINLKIRLLNQYLSLDCLSTAKEKEEEEKSRGKDLAPKV